MVDGMKWFAESEVLGPSLLHCWAGGGSDLGISGGGWTTTVYAALDPRVPVSLPLGLGVAK